MTRRRTAEILIAALSLNAGALFVPVRADGPGRAEDVGAPANALRTGGTAKPQAANAPATKASAKPATGPTTRSAKDMSPEEMLSQMLKAPATGTKPLAPLPAVASGGADKSSGRGAVAPAAPVVNVLREGTFLVDRVGRLSRSADGSQAEFAFESDGTALQDPPVVIIPNLKLMQMEDAAAAGTRDLRFRVSGMVTEYRGRNHILLEKVVVVPEVLEKL